MRVFVLLLLLLTGCTQPVASVQTVLNQYALAAANQADLSEFLTGPALDSATDSADLVRELGLTGYGSSSFSNTRALGENRFESCLDVSGTSFLDQSGEAVLLERLTRQLVEIEMVQQKVFNLRLTGVEC